MGGKMLIGIIGMCCSMLIAGCVSVRSSEKENTDASKRFARDAEGAPSNRLNPADYRSTGSGSPGKREVPALITHMELKQSPVVEEEPTEETPTLQSEGAAKVYKLKRNDTVVIYLRGIPREEQIEVVVDENGTISLPFLDPILALDKTGSELEQTIRDAYIRGKIYKSVTVNVMIPTQSYFIRGEVQRPSRYPLAPGTTILQALATAGGYSEFANARKIKVLRGDGFFFVDAKELEMHPELDREIEPGDVIVVPRSMF